MRTTFAMVATFATFLGGVAFATEQGADAGNAAAPQAVQACSGDHECDDADPRTNDFCERFLNAQQQEGARCAHSPVRDECRANSDCDDKDEATRDTCLRGVGEHGEPEARCSHEASSNGCRINADCDDGNPETRDYLPAHRRRRAERSALPARPCGRKLSSRSGLRRRRSLHARPLRARRERQRRPGINLRSLGRRRVPEARDDRIDDESGVTSSSAGRPRYFSSASP